MSKFTKEEINAVMSGVAYCLKQFRTSNGENNYMESTENEMLNIYSKLQKMSTEVDSNNEISAAKAREDSIEPQFQSAMKDIKQGIDYGWKSTHAHSSGPLYPEVAKRITKLGYDVKVVIRKDDFMSYNEISWENAKENKEGEYNLIDERNLFQQDSDSELIELFSQMLSPVEETGEIEPKKESRKKRKKQTRLKYLISQK